jgi:hypothetical protein
MRVMNGKGNSQLEGAGGGSLGSRLWNDEEKSDVTSGEVEELGREISSASIFNKQFVSFHFTRLVPRFLRSVNYRKRGVFASSACVTI